VANNRDKESEFRLRPPKPAAQGERRVYASAYRIIMHHARLASGGGRLADRMVSDNSTLIHRSGEVPARVMRLNLTSGEQRLW